MRFLFFYLFLATALSSCVQAPATSPDDKPTTGENSYYSLYAFVKDQWEFHRGQPYTLERITVLNGKRDSSIVQAFEADWAAIARPFLEADISARKYLGHYKFSAFEDPDMGSQVFVYEALEKDLPTRSLQITADPFNNRIRTIYVEHEKSGFWNRRVQKLYYEPGRYISIQEWSWSRLGPDKEMRVEYRFLR